MKKYVKPIMESEEFVANEYVGACYWIRCNMPGSYLKALYLENGKQEGLQEFSLGGNPNQDDIVDLGILNDSCTDKHIGIFQDNPPTPNGYLVTYTPYKNVRNVYIWEQDGKYHVTDLSDTDAWGTNTNAS